MELEGRRVLVTGGGRGIGRSIALTLAREGGRVGLLARSREELERVAREIGGETWIGVADVAQPEEVQVAIGELLELWGGIDVLVNNAGVQGPIGPAHEVSAEGWIQTVQVNLVGCYLCTRLVLPGMIERRYGKIVNLSGGGAVSPRPRYSAYSASKAGVERLTESLAAEVAEYGIDVNAVAPGAINTRMLEQTLAAGAAAGEREREGAQKQLEDGGTDPQLCANLVAYLASPRSDGLTGRLISAVWDKWRELDVEELMKTEAFTVRRIKLEEV